MTPSPSNNLDRVYYSFKTTFQMEPYLSELHRGPQRTTLCASGWASTGSILGSAALGLTECHTTADVGSGPKSLPQCIGAWP